MVNQLIATKVSILFKNNELIEQIIGQGSNGGRNVVVLEMRIGSSVQYGQKDLGAVEYDRQKREISFMIDYKLVFQEKNMSMELIVELQSKERKISFIGQMKISQEKQQKSMLVTLINLQDSLQCQINLEYSISPRQLNKYIIFKNIICELKNKLSGSRYALEVESSGKKFRTQLSKDVNTWRYLKIYVEEGDIFWRLYSSSRQIIQIPSQKLSHFPLQQGFRRVYIADQLGLPRGCIQCSYQTVNIRTSEQYQRLAQLQKDSQRKVLKLTLKSVKAKFKLNHKSFKLRILSGSNFAEVNHNPNQAFTEAAFEVSSYLYLEPGQTKCQLIVWEDEKVLGLGALALNIVGFFQRRVQLIDPQSKKQIGYIMAKIHSQKIPATLIQLANLKLTCTKKISPLPCYLSFHLPGCYTRTQMKKIEDITCFIRIIILKFTKEENIQICVNDQNNEEIISSFVSVSSLFDGQMDSNGVHTIEIDKQSGIFLGVRVFSGDLNNLAVNKIQIDKKIEGRKVQKEKQCDSLQVNKVQIFEESQRKMVIKQKQTNLSSERLQKSLSNHIKSFRISCQKNKSPSRKHEKKSSIDIKPSKSKKKRMPSQYQKAISSSQPGTKLNLQLQLPNIKPKRVNKGRNPQRLTYLFQIYHSNPHKVVEYNAANYRK